MITNILLGLILGCMIVIIGYLLRIDYKLVLMTKTFTGLMMPQQTDNYYEEGEV